MERSGDLDDDEDLPLLEVLIALRDLSIPRGLLAEALKILRLDRDTRVASGEPEAVRGAEERVRQLEAIAPADRTKVEELTLEWERILLDERTNGPPTGGWERLEEFEYKVQSICGPEEQELLLILSAAIDERPLSEADPPEIGAKQIRELAERRAASEAAGENWELEYGLSRLFQRALMRITELEEIPDAERTTEQQESIERLKTFLEPPQRR